MSSRLQAGSAIVLVSLLCTLAPVSVLAQAANRVGPELQVNSYTTNDQRQAEVDLEADGDFVVVWNSSAEDGSNVGIFARRFSSAGVALGIEFQVNSYTPGDQAYGQLAIDPTGRFVVVWSDQFQESAGGVFGRRFDAAGVPQAAEFHVNSYILNNQEAPDIASDGDGDFVVVWQSFLQDGDSWGIFARRFDSAGAALASEFQVNLQTTGEQSRAVVIVADDGAFVVVWGGEGQDGDGSGIFARRFSSTGAAQATEFQVNSYSSGHQRYASVDRDDSGRFVVAWTSADQDGNDKGVFARRFDAAGTALAVEFQVNSRTVQGQTRPKVAADNDGDFVIVWESANQDGGEYGIFARRFSSDGVAQAVEFQVNTHTDSYQSLPAVASDGAGDFVVAWHSYGQEDPTSTGVFAQRFGTLRPLDVDGNGSIGALTDGLLVLRFMFEFTGTTLTGGAVGAGCSRCDAAAIAPYLTGLGNLLDIDGNSSIGALTDGLLVLRFLFGFSGTTLTGGAVAINCTRCDAATIVPDLQGLV